MATSTWNGREVKTPTPPRLTPARRKQLEAFRWYNTSLDEALAELEAVETELALNALEPGPDKRLVLR